MVAPTVTAITPVSGLSSGQTLVTIDGTAFDITSPFMTVEFAGKPATQVRVLTTGRLTCKAPNGGPGLVDVKVINATTAESVTVPGAYTYNRPDLTARYHLTNTVNTLISEFKKQIIESVALTTHTDYDSITADGLNIIELSKLPVLLLIGPNIPVNPIYRINERPVVKSGSKFSKFNEPWTTDLEFTIAGIDDHPERVLNLLYVTQNFFQKNEFLFVDKNPTLPSAGQVAYELFADAEGFSHNTSPNIHNIHSFEGSFAVRGFNFEDGEVAEEAFEITSEILTTELFRP